LGEGVVLIRGSSKTLGTEVQRVQGVEIHFVEQQSADEQRFGVKPSSSSAEFR